MKDAGCLKKKCTTELQAELAAFITKHAFYCKIANR